MTVRTRLLINNVLEIISLVSIIFPVFQSVAQLLFQARNTHGSFPLLFLAARTETRRCTRIALSLFVGYLGRSLDVHGYLNVMALLAFDCHDLDATLARWSHRNAATIRIHSHWNMMRFLHRRMAWSRTVMWLLAAGLNLA